MTLSLYLNVSSIYCTEEIPNWTSIMSLSRLRSFSGNEPLVIEIDVLRFNELYNS